MTKRRGHKKTTDGSELLRRRYLEGKSKRLEMLARVGAEAAVGRQIYELRAKAGLSQRQLAKLVGTTASVICRLEDADYRGHSLSMLHRIAAALHQEVKIQFVPSRCAA